jgi:diadenosine tetraphosphate (Ap4A) HIT family hydrolase
LSVGDLAFVIPALGALVPGHLLIIPAAHIPSCRDIGDASRDEFVEFVNAVSARLTEVFGPISLFEHGGCGEDNGAGAGSACIRHAHIHAVPGDYGLANHLPNERQTYVNLSEFLSHRDDRPYLMCSGPDSSVSCSSDLGIGQYFRRVIARDLGIYDRWDYALFPQLENIQATYAALDDSA